MKATEGDAAVARTTSDLAIQSFMVDLSTSVVVKEMTEEEHPKLSRRRHQRRHGSRAFASDVSNSHMSMNTKSP